MAGVKTNECEGTRAYLRDCRMSAYKVRQVLDQIRNQDADRALENLGLMDREAAQVVGKLLASAVANAVHNDGLDADELFVSACYADEGSTLKRWRPRARGRATRIRKRTSHVTVIVSRMPDERIARRRAKAAGAAASRSQRVASSRRASQTETTAPEVTEPVVDETLTATPEATDVEATDVEATEVETTEAETTDVETTEAVTDESTETSEAETSEDAVTEDTDVEAAADDAAEEEKGE